MSGTMIAMGMGVFIAIGFAWALYGASKFEPISDKEICEIDDII